MSKKLLKYYLLSALVSAPVSAADQQAEAGRLGKAALHLMSEEKNIALGSIVASVLEELQRIPRWGKYSAIENINLSLENLPGKGSPIIDELLSYLGRFYPDVAGQLRFPQHALPVAPAAAAAAAAPVAPPAANASGDEEFARRLQEEEDAEAEKMRRLSAVDGAAAPAAANIDDDAEFARRLQEEEDHAVGRERSHLAEEDSAAAAAFQEQFNAEHAADDERGRQQRDLAAQIDHNIALMFNAVNEVEKKAEGRLDGFSYAMARVIGLYESAERQERNMINGAMLNIHELSDEQNREIMRQADPSMDFVDHLLGMQRNIRRERDQAIMRAEAEHEAKFQAEAAAERERAKPAAAAPAAQALKREWIIESINGEPPIRFEMPKELNKEEEALVRFFMDDVNPKLLSLLKAGRITAGQYNNVLRSWSMGILGQAYAQSYGEVARERKQRDYEGVKQNGGRQMQNFYSSLISLEEVQRHEPRLKYVTDRHAILSNLARDAGYNGRTFTTFMTLHTEDEHVIVNQRLNKVLEGKGDKLEEALVEHGQRITDRILILPAILKKTFGALVAQGTDSQWVDFVNAHTSNVCYDGTTDPLIEKDLALMPHLMAGAVDNTFAPLVEKIRSGEWLQKLPGNAGGDVVGFTDKLENFNEAVEAALPAAVKNITKASIAGAAAGAVDAAYAPIRAKHFMGKTLLKIGITPTLAQEVYKQLGVKPGSTACLYSDEDILELMFWLNKQADSLEATPPLLPPIVAKKFGIGQE